MNILLIGHEGYLGCGLNVFLSGAHHVIGWDKKEDLFRLDGRLLARENVELLINFSVMADRQSRAFQVDSATDAVNVGGARHLAKILKGSEIGWIQMSTREVFGALYGRKDVRKTRAGYRPKFLVHERYPYDPQNCYGKSKVMAEFISESHPRSNVIRLNTCYTDFDHPNGNWVVHLIRRAVQGQPVSLTRGGLQFRDPLHIDDLGRLILLLHERKICGEKLHAGGGVRNILSLREFVRLANPEAEVEEIPGGDYGVAFDTDKARRLTGWEPQVLIREKIPVIAHNVRRGVTQPPLVLR